MTPRSLFRAIWEARQRRQEMASGDTTTPDTTPVIGSGDLVTGANPDAPQDRTPIIEEL